MKILIVLISLFLSTQLFANQSSLSDIDYLIPIKNFKIEVEYPCFPEDEICNPIPANYSIVFEYQACSEKIFTLETEQISRYTWQISILASRIDCAGLPTTIKHREYLAPYHDAPTSIILANPIVLNRL